MSKLQWFVVATVAAALLSPARSSANDRRFTFSYESAVLSPDEREVEVWATPRVGRDTYYVRFDERLEFEWGVVENLQSALYLNMRGLKQAGADGKLESEFELAGISSEWKYKLMDPVADALGLALYGEVSAGTDEVELEAKVILDKRVGDFVFATNLVAELEWYLDVNSSTREAILELDFGAAYFLSQNFTLGLEGYNHNEFPEGEGWEHSALYVGPVLSYSGKTWWAAVSGLTQVPFINSHHSSIDLHEHERFNARILLGFHL